MRVSCGERGREVGAGQHGDDVEEEQHLDLFLDNNKSFL